MAKQRLAVILTTWHRLYRLERTLEDMAAQTFRDFDLFVWNNNRSAEKAELIDTLCRKFSTDTPITTIHSYENMWGRGRQILARHLRLKHGYEYVHFVDDDQQLPEGTFMRLWDEKQPTTILAQKAWKVSGPQVWPTQDCLPGEYGFYGATTGALVDTSLFTHRQYWALWSQKYWQVDSLWMSIMARALGWRILKSSLSLFHEGQDDGNALSKTSSYQALWRELATLFNGPQAGRYNASLYEGPLP